MADRVNLGGSNYQIKKLEENLNKGYQVNFYMEKGHCEFHILKNDVVLHEDDKSENPTEAIKACNKFIKRLTERGKIS